MRLKRKMMGLNKHGLKIEINLPSPPPRDEE